MKPLTDLWFDSVESISDRKFERGEERACKEDRAEERERSHIYCASIRFHASFFLAFNHTSSPRRNKPIYYCGKRRIEGGGGYCQGGNRTEVRIRPVTPLFETDAMLKLER